MTVPVVRHNASVPLATQAAQIAIVLMRLAKTSSWDGVVANPPVVLLTAEQQKVLEDYRDLLPYLSASVNGAPLRTVAACAKCGRVLFVGSTAPPKRCALTLGCDGLIFKARSTQEPIPKVVPEAESVVHD